MAFDARRTHLLLASKIVPKQLQSAPLPVFRLGTICKMTHATVAVFDTVDTELTFFDSRRTLVVGVQLVNDTQVIADEVVALHEEIWIVRTGGTQLAKVALYDRSTIYVHVMRGGLVQARCISRNLIVTSHYNTTAAFIAFRKAFTFFTCVAPGIQRTISGQAALIGLRIWYHGVAVEHGAWYILAVMFATRRTESSRHSGCDVFG
jgi:hypothetical protein